MDGSGRRQFVQVARQRDTDEAKKEKEVGEGEERLLCPYASDLIVETKNFF